MNSHPISCKCYDDIPSYPRGGYSKQELQNHGDLRELNSWVPQSLKRNQSAASGKAKPQTDQKITFPAVISPNPQPSSSDRVINTSEKTSLTLQKISSSSRAIDTSETPNLLLPLSSSSDHLISTSEKTSSSLQKNSSSSRTVDTSETPTPLFPRPSSSDHLINTSEKTSSSLQKNSSSSHAIDTSETPNPLFPLSSSSDHLINTSSTLQKMSSSSRGVDSSETPTLSFPLPSSSDHLMYTSEKTSPTTSSSCRVINTTEPANSASGTPNPMSPELCSFDHIMHTSSKISSCGRCTSETACSSFPRPPSSDNLVNISERASRTLRATINANEVTAPQLGSFDMTNTDEPIEKSFGSDDIDDTRNFFDEHSDSVVDFMGRKDVAISVQHIQSLINVDKTKQKQKTKTLPQPPVLKHNTEHRSSFTNKRIQFPDSLETSQNSNAAVICPCTEELKQLTHSTCWCRKNTSCRVGVEPLDVRGDISSLLAHVENASQQTVGMKCFKHIHSEIGAIKDADLSFEEAATKFLEILDKIDYCNGIDCCHCCLPYGKAPPPKKREPELVKTLHDERADRIREVLTKRLLNKKSQETKSVEVQCGDGVIFDESQVSSSVCNNCGLNNCKCQLLE